jgi:hypothetical protein
VDRSIAYIKEHRLIWAIVLSALLHLLFIFLYPRRADIVLFKSAEKIINDMEKSIAFEIIETPEDSRSPVPPEKAELLSDKDALTRDLYKKTMGSADMPYSDGVIDARILPEQMADPSMSRNTQPKNINSAEPDNTEKEAMVASRSSPSRIKFSPEVLLGRVPSNTSSNQTLSSKQKEVSADDVGGIRFNTYKWEFAPYLLYLKKLIQRNIYPPPAFTRLGFGGVNVLRFRIYPDGRLEGPYVLDHDGVEALVETSRKAIEVSAPFNPLPANFPEKYLEVTAKFQYYIITGNSNAE